jgi:tRNA pseudouridine55 synthase
MITDDMLKHTIIYKKLGETPLEALERYRAEQLIHADKKDDQNLVTFWKSVPMTYAGRLDPMAEGELLILIGDECKNKEKYLGLDKEYEVEILFGIETDTYDTLGLAVEGKGGVLDSESIDNTLTKYRGRFGQEYPPYSSKTVGGKQLHELARAGELPEEMPVKEVEIYDIEMLGIEPISSKVLRERIDAALANVRGDFRQQEIVDRWRHILAQERIYTVAKVRVRCSSGTYMRSLAHRIGIELGTGACALSIKRTKIIPPHHIPVLL